MHTDRDLIDPIIIKSYSEYKGASVRITPGIQNLRIKLEDGMETYISLLRGINVSGQNRISVPELTRIYDSLDLRNVATYFQSGNVVFDCAEEDPAKISTKIEAEIARSFGTNVRVILRDKIDFIKILESNPFIIHGKSDPVKLHITFLSDLPSEVEVRKMPHPASDGDEFLVYDKEVYVLCPNGYGKTKFSNTFFERKLNVSATTRNWKTVNALYEMANQR